MTRPERGPSPSRGRSILFSAVAVLGGLSLPFLIGELALRFLPVATGLRSLAVDSSNTVLRFTPGREFTFSRDWNLVLARRGRINNAGFVSDIDYDSAGSVPMVAVIGDSYVEAAMVGWPETMQGRLHEPNAVRVYSFGTSGAPLSQYLAMAKWVRERYRPAMMVIPVIGNDFDESLLRYKKAAGFHYFGESNDGLVLHRVDYQPGLGREIATRSALARYAIFNLGVPSLLARRRSAAVDSAFVGNTVASSDPIRDSLSRRAVDEFLGLLPSYSGLASERIVFLLDGMRPHLYDSTALVRAESSYVGRMRSYFETRASQQAFEVVDLQAEMIQRYRDLGQRFEFPTDNHWNHFGHELAASAVRRSRAWTSLRSRSPQTGSP